MLANVNDGLAMLTKAVSLREDYDDAMAYLNLLYRLRADVDCANKEAHAADLKKADRVGRHGHGSKKKES